MLKLKRLRTTFATTEGRLKAVIVTMGSMVLFLALAVGALEVTSTPVFCSTCHEMSPEYYTWHASAHSNIACVDCHVQPGVNNFISHKIESLKQVYLHFTGTYVTPIAISDPIPNSVCERCHDMTTRVTSPSGDIKFPHTTHLDKGVQCVTCHAGVVHGNIEEKGFTAMTDYTKWNSYVGAAYVSGDFTKLQMSQCIDCHQENGAPTTCETCHTKITKPQSHMNSSWLTLHGPQAQQDIQACNQCHSVTLKYGVIPTDDFKAADYARANTFCNGCHAQKPAGHTADWRATHPGPAKANPDGCLTCHDQTPPRKGSAAPAQVFCGQCHDDKHSPPPFHPVPVPPSGYDRKLCGTCHDARICENCHVKGSP